MGASAESGVQPVQGRLTQLRWARILPMRRSVTPELILAVILVVAVLVATVAVLLALLVNDDRH